MINTFSKFYYGIQVTNTSKWFDFNEGSGELNAEIPVGEYTLETLADAVETALNDAGTATYTVTVNRSTRIMTISSSGSFSVLISTGDNTGNGIYSLLGISDVSDIGSASSCVSDVAIGSSYSPQYKLQDYISYEDMQKLRNATRNKSASGEVEVQSFGTDRMFQFSIKFATDIYQPSGGPITNNSSGVANLRSFMQNAITQAPIEFMPDASSPSTYYTVILESTPYDGNGLGYQLQEQYGRGLVGYYETGILTFRILED